MTPQIRILNETDADELFRLRRRALLDSPFAFISSPEDDMASSENAVREMLTRAPDSIVLGAQAEQLVGMLGLYRSTHLKTAHKVHFWGMFVAPEWRGKKLGEQLLDAAIRHARTLEGVTCIQLGVSQSAIGARRLYEKAGFRVWGVEPEAIRFQNRSECEHHMWLALDVSV
jgi:ribosomal protein S18 acetylase RimI-like enzyme